ncbi:MAG: hypothetical protein ACK5MR_14850 [Cumulibacter sp.]
MTKKERFTGSYYYRGEDKMQQFSVYVPAEISEYVRKQTKEQGKGFKSAYMRELI